MENADCEKTVFSVTELRPNFANVAGRARWAQERIGISRRGKILWTVLPIEDVVRLLGLPYYRTNIPSMVTVESVEYTRKYLSGVLNRIRKRKNLITIVLAHKKPHIVIISIEMMCRLMLSIV